MNYPKQIVAGLMLTGLLALAGCSGSGNKSGASSGGDAAQLDEKRAAAAAAPSAASAATGAATGSGSTGTTDVQRSVVRTAAVTIGVRNVDATADKIVALAVKPGERVDGDQRSDDQDSRTAQLTLRILPARLNEVIAAIDALGKEVSRSIKGEDVTATKADVDAQITALDTSVTRLRTFLAQSTSVPNLLAVEKQLSDRQAELDAMRARQRALSDEISLATLSVQVVQNGTPPAVAKDTGPAGFGSALSDGWHGLVLAWRWVLATLGYILPIGLVVAVFGAVAAASWRRRGHRLLPALATAGGPSATGPGGGGNPSGVSDRGPSSNNP